MPELVPEGPRIPVHLMNEVDEGRVVFFCGAGVSVGDGSNLPTSKTSRSSWTTTITLTEHI